MMYLLDLHGILLRVILNDFFDFLELFAIRNRRRRTQGRFDSDQSRILSSSPSKPFPEIRAAPL
jgi:hypothetical protein